MNALRILAIIPFLAVTACSYAPVVDKDGVNEAKYEKDLAACQSIADKADTTSGAAGQAATNTLVGTAIGALAGAITGNTRVGAIGGAAGGVTTGITQGYQQSAQMSAEIVKKCLTKRGYSVLN
jgi:outer membrane lipoprotein SlyB